MPIPTKMRAMLLTGHGGLDKLVYREDVPVPVPAPKPGEVLIEIAACGVNNTDLNTRTAWYAPQVRSGLTPEVGIKGIDSNDGGQAAWNRNPLKFPRIQGADGVGRIVAVGESVPTSRIGERVITDPCMRDPNRPPRARGTFYIGSEVDGGYAEYAAIVTDNAVKVECGLSDTELATFACSYSTAEEMLARTRLERGETVLVTGASGGVGTATLQLAKRRGARVIAVAGREKERRLRELGADLFVPRERADLAAAVTELVGEQKVDVVIDVVGGPTFTDMLRVLRRAGRYASAGAIAGPYGEIDLRDLVYKDLEMHGVANPEAETIRRLVGYIERGEVKPLVDRTYPLSQLREAHAEFVQKRHIGKIVITVRP
ncbi:MAG: alcohol dehydrogenase family protein [Dongiaceae bacterium]